MTVVAFDTVSGRIGTLDGTALVGVPPADAVVWTSHPYPLEVVESLNAGASVINGFLLPNPVQPIEVSATVLSGTLEVVIAFQTYNAPPELLDTAATVIGGTLDVVIAFQTYNAPVESTDMAATVVAGYLDIVVNHSPLPENLDVGATIIGGTLT